MGQIYLGIWDWDLGLDDYTIIIKTMRVYTKGMGG